MGDPAKKVKVLHLFLTFPNKWQRYSYKLLCRLADAGTGTIAVSVASVSEGDGIRQEMPFPVISLSSDEPLPVRRTRQLLDLIRGWDDRDYFASLLGGDGLRYAIRVFSRDCPVFRADSTVVHVHHAHAASLNLLKHLKRKSIPWIVSFRGHDLMVKPLANESWQLKLKWLFNNASALHVVSEALKKRAVELGAPEEKIHVIRRSLEVDSAIAVKEISPPPYKLVSIGRLVWEKGHIYAVDAVAELLRQRFPVEYHLLGSGNLEPAIRYRAWQLGITEHVFLPGFVNSKKLDQILAQGCLLLHPSLSEAMPNTVIRAQAMGLPVVGSNAGGIPEVVLNGDTGFLVSPADPVALAEKAKLLLETPSLWHRFSENAQKRMKAHFNPELEVQSFRKLYSQLI